MSAITSGYTLDCNAKDNVGGLAEVLLANKCDIDSITLTDEIVTAVVMKTAKQFFKFQLTKSTSGFTLTPTANAQNGTAFIAESLTLVINKMKSATSKIFNGLVKGTFVAIAKDRNGEYVMLGREGGLDVTGGTAGSGTASADRNGYEGQFTGEESLIAHVDPTIIAGLLAPAA